MINATLRKQIYGALFQLLCVVANFLALLFLVFLLTDVFASGTGRLSGDFLLGFPSRFAHRAGILPALVGSGLVMFFTALFAVPLGIGTAIYLEEYAVDSRLIRFIKLNIRNLAGVPSIVYGILGLTLFVRLLGLGRSVLAGSLTMALLILPIITMASQEALRAVPASFRLAGFGIGMTRGQVLRHQVLPLALPGMLTGVILALSRAVGETAPLIMVGALSFMTFVPVSPLDSFAVLPVQIFNWTRRPQKPFHETAAAAIVVLLIFLLLMNAVAVYLRIHYKRKVRAVYG